jgi:hypothetical protein
MIEHGAVAGDLGRWCCGRFSAGAELDRLGEGISVAMNCSGSAIGSVAAL